MSETLIITPNQPNKAVYQELYPQIKALIEGEKDLIANLANVAAALKEVFGWWWVGFYIVKESQLVLGPFQGPIACTRIALGRGVCGTAWKERRSILVPDVNQFTGHIACSSLSKSEIVVPVIKNNQVIAVLDIDSENLSAFNDLDAFYLEKTVRLLTDDIR